VRSPQNGHRLNTLAGHSNTPAARYYTVPIGWCCALSREAAVTAQPIAPVIPSPGRLASTPRVRPAAVRPLPMAGPTAALSVPADALYGTGRIDASGRVTDRPA
jgi:hypothetical protein